MAEDLLQSQLGAYHRWKQGVAGALRQYQQWLDGSHGTDPDFDLRIMEALEALRTDRLVVAFVGEFSRGKSELINALFFSHFRRRLLPTEAGRTTMCPTELFYDPDADGAYLRLLPIETRLRDTAMADYLKDPEAWNNFPLDLRSPEQVASALREVSRVRRVPVAEARRMGLCDDALGAELQAHGVAVTHVDVPVWRHARISFPHPLLEQGLVLLDTPGLNALGSEPELTLSLLPKAHALVFVLGADSGVTRSDLELWRRHVRGFRYRKDSGLIVALNKIDTLWDELRSPAEVHESIENQRRAVARELGLARDSVFPVSAQKGLAARIRQDADALRASRLPELEAILCTDILATRHQIIQSAVASRMDELLEHSRSTVRARLQHLHKEVDELRGLRGRSSDVILRMMHMNRRQQSDYLRHVQAFNDARRALAERARSLSELLDLDKVDALIGATRSGMRDSWTTPGLKRGMKTFFDAMQETMTRAASEADHTNRLVTRVYKGFQQRLETALTRPRPLTMQPYVTELELLHREAEAFRNSIITSMTEQSFVIKKFFITLVSRARDISRRARLEADNWMGHALSPLLTRIRDHKQMLDARSANLRKIQQSRGSLDRRIQERESVQVALEEQLNELDWIHAALHRPLPAAPTPPRAVPEEASPPALAKSLAG